MLRQAIVALLAVTFAQPALGQSSKDAWPTRSVQLIVPYPAGSGADTPARIIAQHLSKRLGQSVVVENRPGASGVLGADMIAKSPPDGHTIGLITASTHAVAPHLEPKPRYNALTDFAPIGMVGAAPYVVVVYPGLNISNVAQLVALAKSKPREVNYGSAGTASHVHLATALFAEAVDIKLTHVPYKASAVSMSDLLTGRIQMQFSTIAPMLSNIREGKIRAIAVSSEKRVTVLPEVPTLAESGVAGFEASLWMAIVAPQGTPQPVVDRLNKEINAILQSEVGTALANQGMVIEIQSPQGTAAKIASDYKRWQTAIARSPGLARE